MMMGIQGDVIQTYIFFMNDIINCCIKMKEGKLYFILTYHSNIHKVKEMMHGQMKKKNREFSFDCITNFII